MKIAILAYSIAALAGASAIAMAAPAHSAGAVAIAAPAHAAEGGPCRGLQGAGLQGAPAPIGECIQLR